MNIFNRKIRMRDFPGKALVFAKMAFYSIRFKRPDKCWLGYLRGAPPSGNQCELRKGLVIRLSKNPHDIITVMVNFCKREYGEVSPGSTVVDVGGNIGVFALFAADSGASRVISFEPNREAFDVLMENILANGLQGRLEAHRLAVSAESGQTVYLPRNSSPYNKLLSGEDVHDENVEAVTTTSLKEIVEQHNIDYLDFLKMDCEGAEYEILMEAPEEILEKIGKIRMELHHSRRYSKSDVVRHLQGQGFQLVKQSGMIYWFERNHK